MLVRELMTPWVLVLAPDATIQEAARKMRAHRIGFLPVVEAHQVLGVITDRDITVRAVADAKHARLTSVRDVMTVNPVTCSQNTEVEEACNLMESHRVRRLLVLNDAGRLAGVLSVEDLAIRARKERLTGHTLRVVARAS